MTPWVDWVHLQSSSASYHICWSHLVGCVQLIDGLGWKIQGGFSPVPWSTSRDVSPGQLGLPHSMVASDPLQGWLLKWGTERWQSALRRVSDLPQPCCCHILWSQKVTRPSQVCRGGNRFSSFTIGADQRKGMNSGYFFLCHPKQREGEEENIYIYWPIIHLISKNKNHF